MIVGEIDYQLNESGFLLKRRGTGLIKQWEDKDGYLKYHLTQPLGTYNVFVHRVVWRYFKGDIPEGLTIDHIDGNMQNNQINNLQLLSPEDNVIKAHAKWWIAVSPDGYAHTVYNLAEFCRNHDLNFACMHNVATGRRNVKQHKGWICHELENS